jgi:RNA polymerase sigma-70 factor, ECF subfamily
MMSDIADAYLVEQLQNGDLEALGVLYDRYKNLVFRTTMAITGDPDAANDLLQDVFLRLYRYIDNVDISRPLEPWLYRIAANLSYTWVKQNNRWSRQFEDFFDWLAGTNGNVPQETAEKEDEWHHLRQALLSLPIQQRTVVVLYYLNDLSLQDISEIMEIPVGTVKSRLHYGRIALRRSMGLAGFAESDALPGLNWEGTKVD